LSISFKTTLPQKTPYPESIRDAHFWVDSFQNKRQKR